MKLAVLLVATVLAAQAGVIVDQSALNGNSFDITDYRLAGDFTPGVAASLGEVQFWYQAQQQTDLASVAYALYADNSGALGTLLDSGTVSNPTTGYDTVSGLFFADFSISPLLVNPGATYWLELHAGTSLTDASGFTVSWAAVDDNASAIAIENLALSTPDRPVAVSGFDQYSFVLSGSEVPEPSAAPSLTAILFIAAAARLYRSRKSAMNVTLREK